MENMIEKTVPQRDISIVTAEIHDICAQAQRMMLVYAVEIGRRLVEAKDILPHGAWGEWLKNEAHFSQSTANKHMKIFEAYGSKQISLFGAELNSETFTNLSYSQALKLLAVPDDERESFVKDNDIENKSVREIDRLIKERDEALERERAAVEDAREMQFKKRQSETILDEYKKKLEAAEQAAEEKEKCVEGLKNGIDKLQAELDKAEDARKKAKKNADKYKQAAENPQIPPEQLEKIKAEADMAASKAADERLEEELQKRMNDYKLKLAAAEAEAEEKKAEYTSAQIKIKELSQKLALANPVVTTFKTILTQAQDNLNTLIELMNKSEPDVKDKLKAALTQLLATTKELIELM